MNKFTALFLLLFPASMIFAEPDTNLYGEFRFDYDITEDMLDGDDPALGGYNLVKAMIGGDTVLSDSITAHFSYRMRMNSLRTAYFDWAPVDGVIVSAGRMQQVFAPESEWYNNSVNKFDGAGIAFNSGKMNFALQTGNTMENPDKKNTGEALYIMPAITYKDSYDKTNITAGVNGKYITAFDDTYGEADEENHLHLNAYSQFCSKALYTLVSADFNDVQDSDSKNLDFNAEFAYKLQSITPGVMMEMHDIVHDEDDMQLDIEIYTKIMVGSSLLLQPIIGLDNMNEANNADFTKMFTLKCVWKPKYQF